MAQLWYLRSHICNFGRCQYYWKPQKIVFLLCFEIPLCFFLQYYGKFLKTLWLCHLTVDVKMHTGTNSSFRKGQWWWRGRPSEWCETYAYVIPWAAIRKPWSYSFKSEWSEKCQASHPFSLPFKLMPTSQIIMWSCRSILQVLEIWCRLLVSSMIVLYY